jgi:hypothetical protein
MRDDEGANMKREMRERRVQIERRIAEENCCGVALWGNGKGARPGFFGAQTRSHE